MVLTRLSHFGGVCPLQDYSYTDAVFSSVMIPSKHNKNSSSAQHPIASTSSTSTTTALVRPTAASTSTDRSMYIVNILDLPVEMLDKIFSYLTYKNIGEIRRVCKRFDVIGCDILNKAFQGLQNEMYSRFQATKAQMPRRESARRKHPLARESDILETLSMRLTLLQMSFGKHIERKHCCFFAGEILDEVYRILSCMKSTPNMGKVFKITDELFDLSTMAMEYFKEHIEPGLPEISYIGTDFLGMKNSYSDGGSSQSPGENGRISEPEDEITERDPLPPSNMVLRKRIRRIKQGMRRYNTLIDDLQRDLKTCKNKFNDQNKQILENSSRFEEYDKKFEESSRKFSTVLQELNKCKTELQYWRSKSPMHPMMCCNCGPFPNDISSPYENAPRALRIEDQPLSSSSSNLVVLGGNSSFDRNASIYQSGESSSSPSSSVKNLEPLFNIESLTAASAPMPKRLYSDDDSETDPDSVGKRVRDRKRLKLEVH